MFRLQSELSTTFFRHSYSPRFEINLVRSAMRHFYTRVIHTYTYSTILYISALVLKRIETLCYKLLEWN